MEQEILNKLETWATPLNNILEYDGLPLWIIYRQMFLTNNFPNRFFNYSIKNLKHKYLKNERESKKFVSFLTRKAVYLNEKIKRKVRNKKRKIGGDEKVLFYTQADKYSDCGIKKIGNFLNEVKKENRTYVLSYEPIEKNSFLKLKKQPHMIYEYINKDLLKKVDESVRKIRHKWEKIPEKQKSDLLKMGDKSLYPFIKDELEFLFSKEFLQLTILYYEAHKKLLKSENISLVCSIGIGYYSRLLFWAAQKLDIPTLIQQHGICFGYLEKEMLKETKFAVFGKHSIEELEESGINQKNTKITGASIFDEIIPYLTKKESEEKIITLLTDGFYIYGLVDEKEYFHYIEKWLREINKIESLKIIIKTHPEEKEHLEKYENIIKNFDNVKLISTPGKEILYPLLQDSAVTINFGSTVALESMILNKPTITITNFHNSKIVEFEKVIKRIKNSGASINITKEEDISLAIKKALEDKSLTEKMKKFVEDSCYKIDGNSSKRAAQFVNTILK